MYYTIYETTIDEDSGEVTNGQYAPGGYSTKNAAIKAAQDGLALAQRYNWALAISIYEHASKFDSENNPTDADVVWEEANEACGFNWNIQPTSEIQHPDKTLKWLKFLEENPRWSTIANFPEFAIYSQPYYVDDKHIGRVMTFRVKNIQTGKEIKTTPKTNGMYVTLYGVKKSIAKLAADTFIFNPYNVLEKTKQYTEIRHLDGDNTNHTLSNLIHATKEMQSILDAKFKTKQKVDAATKALILKEKLAGKSIYDIAKKYNLKPYQVGSIVRV